MSDTLHDLLAAASYFLRNLLPANRNSSGEDFCTIKSGQSLIRIIAFIVKISIVRALRKHAQLRTPNRLNYRLMVSVRVYEFL